MKAQTVVNLDRLCAKYGWEMARKVHKAMGKTVENHITKSLGVLQEDGVYAFFLYQASRGKREERGAEALCEQAHALLKEAGIIPFTIIDNSLEAVRGNARIPGLADNLDDLLLAKRLLEQSLIYARYHAKALGE